MVEKWIWQDNLAPFIAFASYAVGYVLSDGEWEGICLAFAATDVEGNLWLDYPLHGRELLGLSLAQDRGSSIIFVRVQASVALESRLSVGLDLMQEYHLSEAAQASA